MVCVCKKRLSLKLNTIRKKTQSQGAQRYSPGGSEHTHSANQATFCRSAQESCIRLVHINHSQSIEIIIIFTNISDVCYETSTINKLTHGGWRWNNIGCSHLHTQLLWCILLWYLLFWRRRVESNNSHIYSVCSLVCFPLATCFVWLLPTSVVHLLLFLLIGVNRAHKLLLSKNVLAWFESCYSIWFSANGSDEEFGC